MDWPHILLNALWAGLFAGGLAVTLTAPQRYVVPTLLCGFLGRGSWNVFVASGMRPNWATVIAAAVIVLVAAAVLRNHRVSPVVLVCAVLPLGASVAVVNLLFGIMRVSVLEGDALKAASTALIANLGKVCTGSLAVALGLAAGVLVVRVLRRGEATTL